jgi:hypothetical protein
MKLPTDQELGHRIESIVRTIAVIAAFVYTTGLTCGQVIHWLSANLTQLHTHLLKPNDAKAGHVDTHPVVLTPDFDNRVNLRRTCTTNPKGFAA